MKPLSIGVLVDLNWSPAAGGHVKSWERLAEAAVSLPEQVDLTLHFLGPSERVVHIDENVRFVIHRPVFSTERLPFLDQVSGHTDLAPLNRGLVPYLQKYDVIHATHPLFAFGRTALRVVRRSRTPLISSIHTDTAKHVQICVKDVIHRLLGQGQLSRLCINRLQLPNRWRLSTCQKLARYWAQCDRVLVSQPDDFYRVAQVLPHSRISYLRRGLNHRLFSPTVRARDQLEVAFDIPKERFLILYVGRIDSTKNVMTIARAARQLLDQGQPVHVMMVGQGSLADSVRALLGSAVTLPGALDQPTLAWIYASADLFVFPSHTETYGNVVLEAKACGLPAVVSTQGGTAQLICQPGKDGLLVEGDAPDMWANAIASICNTPGRLAEMREAVRQQLEMTGVSWRDVLEHDLLPVWQAVGYPLGRVPVLGEPANQFYGLASVRGYEHAAAS